jgi:AcrR family transcriptional regulator
MNDTKQEILDLAEMLIRTRGYHGFSYKDISERLQVKNAAIHYHFPSKEDLGTAVIQGAIESFLAFTANIGVTSQDKQLLQFFGTYKKSQKKGWVCLVGALSPAYDTLPAGMQNSLSVFVQTILEWVEGCLQQGHNKGLFTYSETPAAKAQLLVSSLLSSLLLNKVAGEKVFRSLYDSLLKAV